VASSLLAGAGAQVAWLQETAGPHAWSRVQPRSIQLQPRYGMAIGSNATHLIIAGGVNTDQTTLGVGVYDIGERAKSSWC
jgi:hypothetical protein